MYVTRPLSHYIRHPESLSTPPEGPNSGYLVLQDEDSETVTCFGLCKSRYLIDLPFPQNKNLTLRYSSGTSSGNRHVSYDDAVFVPVLNQPLSSNLYYAIKPHGSHKGEAYACSREENVTMACLCCIRDEKPRPLDTNDTYQQFQIAPYESFFSNGGRFTAHSIVPDGIPPYFLRRRGWEIYGKRPKKFELGEALGVNSILRAQHLKFDFSLEIKDLEPIVVGKWYCPFMFINDGALKDQMNRSMYYEITLEQRWEQIFTCGNNDNHGNSLIVNVEIDTEKVFVGGKEAVWDENNVVNGVIWFTSGEQENMGLSLLIMERMKWEVTRFGWVKGTNRRAKVDRTEEFSGIGGWSRFGCYVLVERFKLKRMDGSVALTYDFKHSQVVRSKWE